MIHRLTLVFIYVFWFFNLNAQQLDADSLLRISKTGNDREKVQALIALAQENKNNNPQLAVTYASQALEKAKTLNDDALWAKAAQILASAEFINGNFNPAKEHYTEALLHFTNTNNKKSIADVSASLGGLYFAQGNLTTASDFYLKALRLFEEEHNKTGMVNMYSALSNLYSRQNNFSKSIEYGLKAINSYEESSDKLMALVGYDNIGNMYIQQKDLPKAKFYFNKSLRLYSDMRNNAGIASTYIQLGNIEYETGNPENAVTYFKKALDISNNLKIQPLTVACYNALGKAFIELKLYSKAIEQFNRSVAIAKQMNLKIELDEAYEGLALVYKITNSDEKAQTFSALSKELKDSLYNDSTLKRLNDQLLVYESEKQQQQIVLLNKEQQIQENEIKRQRERANIMIGAFSVLGILLVIVLIFAFQNRKIAHNLRKQQIELIEKSNSILEQKEKLDQLNNVKDRFFSIISHDLRNNLTTMKLYFDLISHQDYVASDHSEITKQISGSVENTIDLLENLLIWASAQIKGVPIHIQKLNMHTLTQENINLLGSIAHQKNITLQNNVDESVIAFGDMDMINLVLRNLISNAIKFTNENGNVLIHGNMLTTECIIEVRDNGIGISEENMPRLFNQYEHPTTKGTGNEKGTGLGLMLCKDFIERNGGSIWVKSEKNKGSSFFFNLPLKV